MKKKICLILCPHIVHIETKSPAFAGLSFPTSTVLIAGRFASDEVTPAPLHPA
ncbi:hypothetical protein [Kluyvera sp. CRP]|uniref:hypothetical protein n=1 Tax=Kluyvera sp. CRP TaxID=2873269 RepID=UPI001CC1C5C4|nr:hypothetical protein [Kluyvera sp. CRP]UAK22815.1 hypothetical protein K7B04_04535 [Kluyvera sp. CRP]